MKDYPHDEFFKYLFSLLEAAKVFLEAFLPAEVLACLDLDTLEPDETEYITPALSRVMTDKVFRCKLRMGNFENPFVAAIAILLEHKSFLPPYPHFQLNEYRQLIWKARRKRKKPMFVLPVILYHGDEEWIVKALDEYFGNLPEVLKPYVGDFKYVLVDLSKIGDEQLLRLRLAYLAYGLLTMKHSQDRDWLEQELRLVFEQKETFLKTEEGRTYIDRLFVYFARISKMKEEIIVEKITENLSDMEAATFLSTYDQIILKGVIKGKMEVAENLLKDFPTWSDQKVAKYAGVSEEQVKAIRQRLANAQKANHEKTTRNGN